MMADEKCICIHLQNCDYCTVMWKFWGRQVAIVITKPERAISVKGSHLQYLVTHKLAISYSVIATNIHDKAFVVIIKLKT